MNVRTLTLLACLGLAATAMAAPYQHPTLHFALDLPAGWTPSGADDANPAAFTGADGVVAKVRVTPRPQELTPALAARIEADDFHKIAAKFPRSKTFPIQANKVGNLTAHHYGILYIDAQSAPKVIRFALASRPSAAGHQWIKFQFSYGRLEHAKASPAIDAVLKTFRFVDPPVVARIASPRSMIRSDGNEAAPLGSSLDTGAAAAALSYLQPAAEPPSQPAGEQMDADSAYYLSMNQKMSEKDTKAHIETFRGDGEHRTEEEMARARSYGIGDILKPNE